MSPPTSNAVVELHPGRGAGQGNEAGFLAGKLITISFLLVLYVPGLFVRAFRQARSALRALELLLPSLLKLLMFLQVNLQLAYQGTASMRRRQSEAQRLQEALPPNQ